MGANLRDQVLDLHFEGYEVSRIAEKLGTSDRVVREHIVEKWKLDGYKDHMSRITGKRTKR